MRVTTFGEIMLRLTVPDNQKLVQATSFNANYGGAEANVAVSLALLGDQAAFITKLPNNEIGDTAISKLKAFGVDTSRIRRGGSRIGLYFLQQGVSQRASDVIYDRATSAFATSEAADYPWNQLLDQTDVFYISGITAALSTNLQMILLSAVKFCRNDAIKVIYDANFRGKLWTSDQAVAFNPQILPLVDVCLVHDEDIEQAFGIKAFQSANHQAIDQKATFKQAITTLVAKFPNITTVASILRNIHSPQSSQWMGIMNYQGQFYESPIYDVEVLPEVAGGDAFGAAIVHGIGHNFNPQYQLDYAMAAAVLKLTIPGDFNLSSDAEIKAAMISNNGKGKNPVNR
ncbi:sugar kinase [Lentilactobacillus buchneri]|uniref:sugar kinase n=1 Tax=Lentilactobacillus buchneri TaxID=1581 RepID=UPI00129196C7|nr:sugar kinase [Lentilactobacillus buchneri]MQN24408.1 sugar kinase [Lentilactobacillus buchneri]